MTKILKKVGLFVAIFTIAILLNNSKTFAASEKQEKAYNDFINSKLESTYTLYVGENFDPLNWETRYYLTVELTSDNQDVAEVKYNEINTKKVGTANITIKASLDDQTTTKECQINVIKSNENTKLESDDNDVISITSYTTPKILLANSELWNTTEKDFTLSTKDAGNVSKFVYSNVYENRYDAQYIYRIKSVLKKDGILTVENYKGTSEYTKVKQANDYGYLSTNGKYYMYELDKNKNITTKRLFDNVKSVIGDFIINREDGTYVLSGIKLADFITVDADEADCMGGLILSKSSKLYSYSLNKNVYELTKIENNVDCLLGNGVYKTKSGELKKVISKYENNQYKTSCERYTDNYEEEIKQMVWLYGEAINILTLKKNDKAYLNGIEILTDVDAIYGAQEKYALFVRKDGSIWKLTTGGNSSLTKIRTGQEYAKRISEPTYVKAVKASDNVVKVKWHEVEGAVQYTVYRSNEKDGKYTKVGTTTSNSLKNKVDVGVTYYYKVVSNYTNSSYDSKRSEPAKIKIPKIPTKIKAYKKTNKAFKVTFNTVNGATGYEVEYSLNNDFSNSTRQETIDPWLNAKGLSKNQTYYVRVRAYKTIRSVKTYSAYSGTYQVSLK